MPDIQPRKFGQFYAFVVVAVVFTCLLAAAGLRSAPGVLLLPWTAAFGWSRGIISLAAAIGILLFGLMGPFAAALMLTLGIRRVLITALAMMAAATGASYFMTTPLELILTWGVTSGLASGCVAMTLGATIVNRWFTTNRGLVMGILSASTSTGTLAFLPLLAFIAQHGGWRPVVLTIWTDGTMLIGAAVREGDGAEYIFNMGGRLEPALLALVPPHANVRVRFLTRDTAHSDMCTFHRTLLELGPELFQRYRHFVLINNGMRGPFVEAGSRGERQHWAQPFLAHLSRSVKLVGPYLSCEKAVHIQGPFLATDRFGVQYMLDAFGGCWKSHAEDIEFGEVGLSQAILESGHNIASLQPEYQGIDFRQYRARLRCRGRRNPTFCCGVQDPLRLHWVKHGGEVYRQGLIPGGTLRLVAALTVHTAALAPPLVPNSRWRAPNSRQQQAGGGSQRQAASLLARTSAALLSLFRASTARRGNQLHGVQDSGAFRYISLLDNTSSQQFRYSLFPHTSGFASADEDQQEAQPTNLQPKQRPGQQEAARSWRGGARWDGGGSDAGRAAHSGRLGGRAAIDAGGWDRFDAAGAGEAASSQSELSPVSRQHQAAQEQDEHEIIDEEDEGEDDGDDVDDVDLAVLD